MPSCSWETEFKKNNTQIWSGKMLSVFDPSSCRKCFPNIIPLSTRWATLCRSGSLNVVGMFVSSSKSSKRILDGPWLNPCGPLRDCLSRGRRWINTPSHLPWRCWIYSLHLHRGKQGSRGEQGEGGRNGLCFQPYCAANRPHMSIFWSGECIF